MRLNGLSRLIYLLEGDLAGYRKATTGQDKSKTIRSCEASTLAEVRCVVVTAAAAAATAAAADVVVVDTAV